MKKLFIFIILTFLIFTYVQAQNDLSKLLSEAGNSSDFPGSQYLIVFDKTNVEVMDSGLSLVTNEIFYKVLTKQGAKQLKSLTFGYDPQTAYIEVKKAKIVKKCGKMEDISLNSINDYPAPAWGIYWGAREKIVPITRLEPGDGVWVKTYRKGFTYALLFQESDNKYIPPMKGHFYDIVPFYSKEPIAVKTYKISIPSNKTLQFEFYNGEARHYAHNEGDRMIYLWEKKDIRPIKREANMVSFSDIAPKLLLSTSPNWKAKSLWFYKVNEDFGSFDYDDDIKEKVNDIVKGAKDDWEKISRLTHWVAEEIRYSGISMGEGEGYTLHKGTMTFRDRCGVCKDKAGMLITMLRAAGYESFPAMTMAGSRIDRIPADQFNHCVTLIKLKGKYHLLDPTWVPGVRELWSSAEQQQEYLMGVPEGADLKSTPISPSKNHYIKYRINSYVTGDGSLKAHVEICAEGQSDSTLRRYIGRGLKNQRPLFFEREFFDISSEAKVSKLSCSDLVDISKPIKINFSIEIPNYLKKGKRGAYLTPISSVLPFSRALFFSRIRTELKKRKYPFRTRCSQLVKVKETIKFTEKFSLVNNPKFEKVEGKGADFNGYIKQKGKKIIIVKNIMLKKRIYQPEDWESFRKSVQEFKKPEGEILILKKGGNR